MLSIPKCLLPPSSASVLSKKVNCDQMANKIDAGLDAECTN